MNAELTAALRAEVTALEDDLRVRMNSLPQTLERWQKEHSEALDHKRTAASWTEWSEERLTQVAVAWVLTTVFVRFVEDNDLVGPVWITGHGGKAQQALDAQADFLRNESRHRDVTDRDWLLQPIEYFRSLPATAGLVDDHNPLRQLSPSGDAATRLLKFWRERDEHDRLVWDLRSSNLDTRFLGDLYQNLSESAKSRYALLQTPDFVEEFILDQTLTPALQERQLEGFRMIDPACGSGHFLLGAFARLLERWKLKAPGFDDWARIQAALDSIHGVDINPYAVAIARFRLTVAALRAGGVPLLERAPAFSYHLAVGDSLLHGLDQQEFEYGPKYIGDGSLSNFTYTTENLADLKSILQNRRYDVVVGNPPYITVKDMALNAAYRGSYHYCKGKYALTMPFMERFFALAKNDDGAGWVGQITSNSFMKREFGAPVIENFLAKLDLKLVADTSGAYIPGHGTPTVIIVGRNRRKVADTVRAVLGVRGEPGRPEVASKGVVWTAMVEHLNEPSYSDEWVTITDLNRSLLDHHPWSLTGGGAVQLLEAIDRNRQQLSQLLDGAIGFYDITGADDVFASVENVPACWSREKVSYRRFSTGEHLRDWITGHGYVIWPYINQAPDIALQNTMLFWPYRVELRAGLTFGKTREQRGMAWHEHTMLSWKRVASSHLIAFACVATHNHFILDRQGGVYNRHAPVIKLPADASADDHLALLGVLNSSTACFWLKQNSYPKGGDPVGDEGARVSQQAWGDRYEFTGTTLQDYPLPSKLPVDTARWLDRIAQRRGELAPSSVVADMTPNRSTLDEARSAFERIGAEMIARQEELDWEVYGLYALLNEDLTYDREDLPPLVLGQRAFEIVLARKLESGDESTAWFQRHRSTPIIEIPEHWPEDYRRLVDRRIELIESHPYIRLLERPEYKRRWASEPWEQQEERAIRNWLLDRLEGKQFWLDRAGRPTPKSIAVLADDIGRDDELVEVLRLWEGRSDVPVIKSLERLLKDEGVPFLAAYRYKDSGLRKRRTWEEAWDKQREEDATGKTLNIAVPPKYTSADFKKTAYWSHRGKLDVPKERFILYPGAGRSTDPTAVFGWAGWDHAQQGLALAQLLQDRAADGWEADKLVPLVAGLDELLPWIEQWHTEREAMYGGVSPADFFREQLETWAQEIGRTRDELKAWRPEPTRRGRTRKAT